jgi:hypothetical protein
MNVPDRAMFMSGKDRCSGIESLSGSQWACWSSLVIPNKHTLWQKTPNPQVGYHHWQDIRLIGRVLPATIQHILVLQWSGKLLLVCLPRHVPFNLGLPWSRSTGLLGTWSLIGLKKHALHYIWYEALTQFSHGGDGQMRKKHSVCFA